MRNGYLRHPSLHGDQLAFVCEDDLWLAPAEGGLANRLTAGDSDVTWPRFAPDGERLAFVSREAGPADVFAMPVAGGVPARLTHHGQVRRVAGWTPDGSAVLYASSITRPDPSEVWLHRVGTGAPDPLPRPLRLGPAAAIAHGPGGAVVIARDGGAAGVLWIDPDGAGTYRRLIELDGHLAEPCWIGDRVCFLSDHEGRANVYSCTPDGEGLCRHTDHRDFSARGLAGDGRRLVYHAGGDVYLLDPERRDQPRRVELEVRSSLPQRRQRTVAAQRHLDWAAPSPDGASLAITSRGRAFALPSRAGPATPLGEPDGVRYRLVGWLSGGRRLVAAASADETGEQLAVLAADGGAPDQRLDLDVGRIGQLEPCPTDDLVALTNHRGQLLLLDLVTGAPALRELDRSDAGPIRGVAWSPDGRWLAYGWQENRETCAIKLCEVGTGRTTLATRSTLRYSEPAFDPDGRYLYCIGQRPHAICLRADVPNPFDPAAAPDPGPPAVGPLRIDLDGIQERVAPFPLPEAPYLRVQGARGRKALLISSSGALECYDLARQRGDLLAAAADDFRVGRDGATVLVRTGGRLRVMGTDGGPDREIDLDRVRVSFEPLAEWRQVLDEAWSLLRDLFWSADFGGVDWPEVHRRYRPLVERVAARSELADLLRELLGELRTSDVDLIGDTSPGLGPEPGFLGVDWDLDPLSGACRVARIIRGDPLDAAAASPLARQGVDVRAGDRVLAIDGRRVSASTPPAALLAEAAGRDVALTVQRPGGATRRVTVRALADDRAARYVDWVEANRRSVHESTGGRVGYAHLLQGFLLEHDRDALIVDVRGSAGGDVATELLDRLARRRIAYGTGRLGRPAPWPAHSPAGRVVCLTSSAGDLFSLAFKALAIGPLVGTRRRDGGSGISSLADHRLADGTIVTYPALLYAVGEATPDVEVDNAPHDYGRGADVMLERAVAVALERLADPT